MPISHRANGIGRKYEPRGSHLSQFADCSRDQIVELDAGVRSCWRGNKSAIDDRCDLGPGEGTELASSLYGAQRIVFPRVGITPAGNQLSGAIEY
jgi:hypothetical protein